MMSRFPQSTNSKVKITEAENWYSNQRKRYNPFFRSLSYLSQYVRIAKWPAADIKPK